MRFLPVPGSEIIDDGSTAEREHGGTVPVGGLRAGESTHAETDPLHI